MSNDNTNK